MQKVLYVLLFIYSKIINNITQYNLSAIDCNYLRELKCEKLEYSG